MRIIRQYFRYPNALAIVAPFLAAGGVAWAASGSGGTIHACYKKHGGALRVASRCKRGEKALSWNQIGPRGAKGSAGKAGGRGATGPQGPAGPKGEAGQVRAYATITPGNPAKISTGSHGVVSAKTTSGITCVFLEPSINVASTSPVVTSKIADVTFAASPGSCSEGTTQGVQVKGYGPGEVPNTTETFSIVVP
jgi:hypothetical protein